MSIVYRLFVRGESEDGNLNELVQDGLDIKFDLTIPAKAVLIGANEGCDIRINDERMSGLHALLLGNIKGYSGIFVYDMYSNDKGLSAGFRRPMENLPVFLAFVDDFEMDLAAAQLFLDVPKKNGGVTDKNVQDYRARIAERLTYHLFQVDPADLLGHGYRIKRGSQIYFCSKELYDGSQPSILFGTQG